MAVELFAGRFGGEFSRLASEFDRVHDKRKGPYNFGKTDVVRRLRGSDTRGISVSLTWLRKEVPKGR